MTNFDTFLKSSGEIDLRPCVGVINFFVNRFSPISGISTFSATASGADDAKTASETVTKSTAPAPAELHAYAMDMLGEVKGKDAEEYQRRGIFLTKTLFAEFGVSKLIDITAEDDRARAMFYLKRIRSGKDVDFSADYDYDGAPDQDGAADDEFDIG